MRKLKILQAILTLMVAFAFAGMGKVTAYAAGSDVFFVIGSDGNQRKDLKDVNGLSWDATNSTLTMDGYEGKSIYVESSNGVQDVKVVVKGENSIKFADLKGFSSKSVNLNFVGTGTLNIKCVADNHIGHIGLGNSNYDDAGNTVEINGPTINFIDGYVSAFYVKNLIMKSGNLYFELSTVKAGANLVQNPAIFCYNSTKITGGTIVVKYLDSLEVTDVRPVIYTAIVDGKVDGFIDNCTMVVSGDERITSKASMAGAWGMFGGPTVGYDVKEGENNIFEKTDLLYYFKGVNISKFKATLSQTSYNYDGKAKTPKVTLGSLIEGTDFTVKYENNINPGTATAVVTGKNIYTGEIKLNFTIVDDKQKDGKANTGVYTEGKVFTDGLYNYKVIKSPSSDGKVEGEVILTGLANKKIHILVIPGAIKKNDVRYKVVKIGNKAFKGNKKLKKVDIDHHIEKIGKQAFYNCKSLTEVNIFTKDLKTIGKQAFFRKKGKKLIIRVPKGLKKKYKKMLKKAKTNKYVVKKYVPITKK